MYGVKINVDVSSSNVRTVTSSTMMDGTAIDPNKDYKGVTIQYLINGGDRFS